jgi:alkaline phosphatase
MTRSRSRALLVNLIQSLAAILLAVITLFVWGLMDQFELSLGPLILKSQRGISHSLPIPTDSILKPRQPLQTAATELQARPRSVILIIGDGMGLGQVSSTSALLQGPAGGLALEQAPVVGLVQTFAADNLVTDSAAAASAMATGFKTNCKMVSQLADGSEPLTLFEAAAAKGLATGVVTTSGLMDATPAAFTAHESHRNNEAAILTDQLRSGTDLMIGAAWGHLDHIDEEPELAAALDQARTAGYSLVTSEAELQAASIPLVALLLPDPESPDRGDAPLPSLVSKAIAELAGTGQGFVLLVEQEETDQWGHDNDIRGVVAGAAELDAAIKVVLELTEHDPEILVLITADHDTGGLGLVRNRSSMAMADVRWTSDEHTSTWVPLFAFGPGAERFNGVLDNTEIARRLGELLELQGFPAGIGVR